MFSKATKNIRQALARLNVVRCALEIYKTDHNGAFPQNLQELAPKYISRIPELNLPGHENISTVTVITKKVELALSVTNSGGWLYFFTPEFPDQGKVILDCTDTFNNRKIYEF